MQCSELLDLTKIPGVICGAGSSAYASAAIATAWPLSKAVPTTDLVVDPRSLEGANFLLSLARSGDSPESSGAAEIARRLYPSMPQFAIICNSSGKLANYSWIKVTYLDPRTNDRALAMTSSFSNLALAGVSLAHPGLINIHLQTICLRAQKEMPTLKTLASDIVRECPDRVAFLTSSPLFPWAQEASLKLMEMTGGRVPVMAETYLGLRHGPMSFIGQNTLIVCLISNDRRRVLFELDLLAELRLKRIGRIVGIIDHNLPINHLDVSIKSVTPGLPDYLRTPFEVIFPQLLAYECSLRLGFDPDNPSPEGIISRVVPKIRIH